jgi:hypothetical protein
MLTVSASKINFHPYYIRLQTYDGLRSQRNEDGDGECGARQCQEQPPSERPAIAHADLLVCPSAVQYLTQYIHKCSVTSLRTMSTWFGASVSYISPHISHLDKVDRPVSCYVGVAATHRGVVLLFRNSS